MFLFYNLPTIANVNGKIIPTAITINFVLMTMDKKIMETIGESQYKKRPELRIGDTLKLHMKIAEGDKERTQLFEGILIAKKGIGLSQMITVRKITYGIGVERIVPLHSPILEKIEVVKRGDVRRAKLYYMRERVGKLAMKIRNSAQTYLTDEPEAVEPEKVEETEEKADAPKKDVKAEPKEEVKEEKKEKPVKEDEKKDKKDKKEEK